MKLSWGAASHVGMVRQQNEDAYVAESNVFAVADGMGGHNAGEVASALAVDGLRRAAAAGFSAAEGLVAAINTTNATIHEASGGLSEQRGMGTTLTALVPLPATDGEPQRVVVANVGDSRIYLWRGDELKQVSADHSYVQELLSEGLITAEEARIHPRRNIVTRALGIEGDVNADSWVLPMVVGDRYVLCSDGLVDEVDDEEIATILRTSINPQVAADHLVRVANEHGGRDNTTVVVVDILADTADVISQDTTQDTSATRTTPTESSAASPSDAAAHVAASARPRRMLVAVALVAVLALGVLSAVGWYARGGYFVGFAGEGDQAQLVVFKGRTNHILWFRPTIEIDSGVERQAIFPSLADDIDDQPKYDSLARAEAYVNSIRDVIEAQKPAAGDGT
ncbi:MAG: Stp1/IreP family PP2C-type Ser/Thr phosphatase [Ilumatobacteraceae bacterium]|nr:Stp1/IreP family PP2C-type Ser/Thr phosphatase [Ilumatobacteraceae bacterium]